MRGTAARQATMPTAVTPAGYNLVRLAKLARAPL